MKGTWCWLCKEHDVKLNYKEYLYMKYSVEILDKLEFENKEYEYKFKLET